MKKITLFITAIIFLATSPAMAIPFLQLDISNSVYDPYTETVQATSSAFTLYALVNSTSSEFTTGSTYFISAAISPQISQASNLGSFSWDGTTVNATSDMTYGTPPIEDVAKSQDLPSHGVFPTYFTEFSFTLDPLNTASAYNVQDTPGSLLYDPNGSLYYAAFALDVSGFSSNYGLHFDLYTKNADGTINSFAPFSHDAQTAPVPEPATMLLLGTGLIGIAGFGRKKFKK